MNAERQRRLREYESPTYGYRLGEGGEIENEVFDGVLPKGWADTPADVGKERKAAKEPEDAGGGEDSAKTAAKTEAADSKTDAAPSDSGLARPYSQHKAPALNAELKRRTGKGRPPGTTNPEVVARLEALDAA